MKFLQLLDGAEVLDRRGDPEITGLDYDSRRIKPGFAFVAMKGETTDGNRFIDKAIAQGAVAVVSDSETEPEREQVAWARVGHGRRALARLSANFYGRPAEKLANTGVTGTNGKTTTTFLVESILNVPRKRTILIGTIEYHVLGRVIAALHTTPEALELNQMLAQGLKDGATETVMEVSSHALEQQRVYGIPYDVAVFTNLTRDHLDYHKTMKSYFESKRILFEGCGTFPPRVAVINVDDEYGRELVKFSKKRGSEVVTYGLNEGDFHAANVDIGLRGTRFDLIMPEGKLPIWSPLIGRVNVYNIMAACAAAWARGCTDDLITSGITALKNVPGRFQPVIAGQPFTVVVDYAHTDDALKNLTALAREFVQKANGRVITVFGCGGDRDRTKRPLMGEAAGRGSDFVILTSDNPRSEDPMSIISDAKTSAEKTATQLVIQPDRRKAIALALQQAKAGDIVLVAGKGHEKTQTTREGVFPFDDVEVARELLAGMGFSQPEEPKA
ncbi:MAG TPA: UDP-N-acetylmuramoyl-L-alanyl-D-glutamate--2,6-diaminopimelate ligase [Terriglobales bacterium]|nr:UDP-N-acetylmuramoyl-L-alanyl-D-glutamate--2,6-diaminopimelate ligase [Terriglobales bacterium]